MANELLYTVGVGIFCSTGGWIVNSLYSRYVNFREMKAGRYQTALSEFYWPLYCILLELQGLYNDIENPHNEADLNEMYSSMNCIIKEKMGFAFPKRAISRPIITLLTLLHKGNIEGRTLKYVTKDCIDVVSTIVETRLFTMSKKYNELCDEKEDRYTFALYTKIVNQYRKSHLEEWIKPLNWWFSRKRYNEISKDRRDEVLQIFAQSLYCEEYTEDMETFSVIDKSDDFTTICF